MESIIPKKIHYCWFGNGEKPKFICDCINTWKTVLNDYEIVEWNESNFDVNINKYVKEAYEQKNMHLLVIMLEYMLYIIMGEFTLILM